MIPKLELHCHLEGTATPELTKRLAARNQITLPNELFGPDGEFAWHDFISFLNAYDLASACIATPLDYRDVTYEYLAACAKEGAIYVEVFSSPDHAETAGMTYAQHLEGIVQGIEDAERDFEIIGRIIVTCVRHLGPDKALNVASQTVDNPHPFVVGFGMGGDENQFHPKDFAPAFYKAFDEGLACTAHAGEIHGPQSVIDALDHLPITRIGHGVRSVEDPKLVERLVRDEIILEVCPGSNFALGLYKDTTDHPLRTLLHAGCKVTLGSDDPPYFGTTIGKEYQHAETAFKLTPAEINTINHNAVDGAFCNAAIKQQLRKLL